MDPIAIIIALIGFAFAAVVVTVALWSRRRRRRRRHRRSAAHQHWSVQRAAAEAERRAAAGRIIATSSTDAITGFEVVRQIEAVFVDSAKSADEALEMLKATAAQHGANAVINVRGERMPQGGRTAQGDAVIVRPIDGADAPPGASSLGEKHDDT